MPHSPEAREPVGDALDGLVINPLLDGWTPLEAIVLVKCLDDDGSPSWAFRTTDGINDEELLGALVVRTDMLRRRIQEQWE